MTQHRLQHGCLSILAGEAAEAAIAAVGPYTTCGREHKETFDLGPKGVNVSYFIIYGSIGKDDSDPSKLDPNAIADTYWHVATQPQKLLEL
jgi:hypothetical protein